MGQTFARTCGSARGGANQESGANATGILAITVPIHPARGPGGTNTSWWLHLHAWDATRIPNSACPITSVVTPKNLGYTWVNTTNTSANCRAEAGIGVTILVQLIDLRTGLNIDHSRSANHWSLQNRSGEITEWSVEQTNYSNPAYWLYNATSTSSQNASSGASGSLNGSYAPEIFENSSFHARDPIEIWIQITTEVRSEVLGYGRADVLSVFDTETHGTHERLAPIQVW
jgi:hypothetical protein